MKLFRRLFAQKDPEDTGERLDRLEAAMRRLEEEWTDVYGKFRVMQMRVAKQVQRLPESSQEEPQQEGEDGDVPGPSSLSPRLQKIQREILARRQRGASPMKGGE
jgi:hypothetical protein